MITRRTLLTALVVAPLSAPRLAVAQEAVSKCATPTMVSGDGVAAEFSVTPRHKRWQRDTIVVRCPVHAWEDAVAATVALVDRDLTRKKVVFRAGGDERPRDGEIVVLYNPALLPNWLGEMRWWLRERDPEAVSAAKVWLGIGPEDARFREVLLHEIGHALGLGHEDALNIWGTPIAIMHSTLLTWFQEYTPDDLRGLAALRYRGGDAKQASAKRRRRKKGR